MKIPSPGATTVIGVDRAGIWLSSACAVHCLALPLIIAAMPFLAVRNRLFDSLESLFVVLSVMLATVNLCWGIRIHRSKRLVLLFGTAVVLIIVGKCLVEGPGESILVTAGAFGIAASHFFNRRLCLDCFHCDKRDHSHD